MLIHVSLHPVSLKGWVPTNYPATTGPHGLADLRSAQSVRVDGSATEDHRQTAYSVLVSAMSVERWSSRRRRGRNLPRKFGPTPQKRTGRCSDRPPFARSATCRGTASPCRLCPHQKYRRGGSRQARHTSAVRSLSLPR